MTSEDPKDEIFYADERARSLVENASRVAQLRQAAIVGLVAWPFFGFLDWFMVAFVEPGRLWLLLLLRLVGMLPLMGGMMVLHYRKNLPSWAVLFIDALSVATMVALIAIMSLEVGGIKGPLSLGIAVVLVARGALLGDSWRRSVVPVALAALAYPAVMLVAVIVSPEVAADLGEWHTLAYFLLVNSFIISAAALALVGGHMSWQLRRRLYDTSSLGRYDLLNRIGRGGMGEVWRAHDRNLERDVAVKVLKSEGEVDDRSRKRFEQEARATSDLTHPNTIRVFDFGVTASGVFYYAMELLEGHDLKYLIRRGPTPPARAVDLIVQACHGLAEAHERGIVHRDIKPENVFVIQVAGRGDHVKVLDFGLAKVVASNRSSSHAAGGSTGTDEPLTRVGWAVGTPKYMAPEAAAGLATDERTDVYALGTVLFHLLAAALPFKETKARDLFNVKLTKDPPAPSTRLGAPLPPGLEAIVLKAIAKDPDKRYGGVLALADALLAADLGAGMQDSGKTDESLAPEALNTVEDLPRMFR